MRRATKIETRKDGERGFALLIVFLLAAAVALMLYSQMRRVAFESEREKEQLLQDRGQQYVRAIQLYYIAFKKYPSKIEDLENTNNKRFLRRRYIDPMTGKDEWRFIHVNGAGQLTDSLVQKPPAGANGNDPNNPQPSTFAPGSGNGTAGAINGLGTVNGAGTAGGTGTTGTAGTNGAGAGDGQQPQVNAAVLRRPSDRILTPPGGIGATSGDIDPNDQRYWPPITLQPQGGQNGQNGQTNGNQQQYPGQQAGGLPGGFQPGLPGQFPFQQGNNQQNNNTNQAFNGQNGVGSGQPGSTNSGSTNQGIVPGVLGPGGGVPGGVIPGGGVFGFPSAGGQNGVIPNSGQNGTTTSGLGLPNSTNITGPTGILQSPPSALNGANNNAIGAGGIVGVASTYKGPSIKIYKDRQKYQEWEFIFDLKSGMQNPQQAAQNNGQNNGQNGQNNGQGTNGQSNGFNTGFNSGLNNGSNGGSNFLGLGPATGSGSTNSGTNNSGSTIVH